MGAHSIPTRHSTAALRVVAVIAAISAAGLFAGSAGAAPKGDTPKGNANGHLVLTVGDEVITAGPGKALKLAKAECAALGADVNAGVDVAAVRAAFPEPVEVCAGVTLTSQVAADEDETA